ncbi:MAG: LapA family protein [Magnetococcales bacterium]|nr:LapA family protein [Magnetococcales bacterium]
MSGLLNIFFIFFLTAAAVLFALSNQNEVDVSFPGGLVISGVPLFVVTFVPMFIGFFLGIISAWFKKMKYRRRMDEMRQKNRDLAEELTNLRNLPLDSDTQLL